jgi:large subunit ribosomal protein L29
MKRLKHQEIESLSADDRIKRLSDLRAELSRLRSAAARGTLKKELGELKSVRRNIARVLTVINEEERKSQQQEKQTTRPVPESS